MFPLKSGIDPENISFLLFDISRLMRGEFEQRVAEAGLGVTPAEARVLAHVARCQPIRQHLLADRLGIARMSITTFIDRLEGAGLLERVADPEDRRAKFVSLTDEALPIMRKLEDIGEAVRLAARGAIPAEEWELFRKTALAVRSNFATVRQQVKEMAQ